MLRVCLIQQQMLSRTTTCQSFSNTPPGSQGAISGPRPTNRHAHITPPRLDLSQLEDDVSFYIGKALAQSTLRSYSSGQKRFFQFCVDAALHLTERLLCLYVAQPGKENLTHQTIKCYLSAIRFLSISMGHGDPFVPGAMPVLQYVLRGVKRSPRLPVRTRLPITPSILQTLKNQWVPKATDTDYVMLWAACCVGIFSFLRAGEFTVRSQDVFDPSFSLTLGDIAVDQPSIVRIRLKQSKTDPFRRGVNVFLGQTNADLCPVTAILAYVALRPQLEGPLFVFQDGLFLTRDKLVEAVLLALHQAGKDPSNYTGHSFRIGAATTAAQVGLEDSVIKMLGVWESSAYQRCIETPRDTLAALSVRLAAGTR